MTDFSGWEIDDLSLETLERPFFVHFFQRVLQRLRVPFYDLDLNLARMVSYIIITPSCDTSPGPRKLTGVKNVRILNNFSDNT